MRTLGLPGVQGRGQWQNEEKAGPVELLAPGLDQFEQISECENQINCLNQAHLKTDCTLDPRVIAMIWSQISTTAPSSSVR